MALFVDTSVWSMAFRRDGDTNLLQVAKLQQAIVGGELLFTTGIVVQELLQGFNGPKQREVLLARFSVIPLIWPSLADHIAASELGNICRRNGVQCGTVDALIAQLCIRANVDILTTDNDFIHMAKHCALRVWSG